MEVIEAIASRRAIRRFKPDPVDDAAVTAVLEAARWAPSWANSQCARFIVVRDETIRQRLQLALLAVDPDFPNAASKAFAAAPVVIVACAEVGKSGRSHDFSRPVTDKGDFWYMYDVGLAMQNLTLAARALGLGTVHVGAFDAKKVGELLGVPDGFAVVAMTPLGYPEKEPAPRPRKELAEITFHERFGQG